MVTVIFSSDLELIERHYFSSALEIPAIKKKRYSFSPRHIPDRLCEPFSHFG
jgi:hypothetical protein